MHVNVKDCYVAVTGLPQPQPDHAVRMMKFAADCIDRMKELVHGKLVDELGADTATLAMRVGCHTGSVTGGALRGDKGRFQLFGDTMNTAAVGSLRIGKHLDERFCFFPLTVLPNVYCSAWRAMVFPIVSTSPRKQETN